MSAEKIGRLFRNWLRLLPHPFTKADRQGGWLYDISISPKLRLICRSFFARCFGLGRECPTVIWIS
jgi:hypothetical protein